MSGPTKETMGSVLRFLASGGMAEEDPDVVVELLTQAQQMASMVLADPTTSEKLRATARFFLDQLDADTFHDYRRDRRAGEDAAT